MLVWRTGNESSGRAFSEGKEEKEDIKGELVLRWRTRPPGGSEVEVEEEVQALTLTRR